MTLVDLQQVKSNETKLIDFISDDGCDCSSSWHYSVNAAVQHRGRFIQTQTETSIAIQKRRGQAYYRDTKDDNGSNELVNLKIYISLLFYYCPDKCVSLVLLLV